jgi:Fic family protein
VQHCAGDITEWMDWFLHCLKNAMLSTEKTTQKIVRKAAFWKTHEHTRINERQRIIINKLLEDFEEKFQTSKWAKIVKTSTDTALRDIKDLIEKGILKQTLEGGRNVNYELMDF